MPSPKQQLIEHIYPGNLAADVAAWLAGGKSWRDIATLVSARSKIEVSHESLRSWYGKVAA